MPSRKYPFYRAMEVLKLNLPAEELPQAMKTHGVPCQESGPNDGS